MTHEGVGDQFHPSGTQSVANTASAPSNAAPGATVREPVDLRACISVFDEMERPVVACHAFRCDAAGLIHFAPRLPDSIAFSGESNKLLVPTGESHVVLVWHEGYVPKAVCVREQQNEKVVLSEAHELHVHVRTDKDEPVAGYAIGLSANQLSSDFMKRLENAKEGGAWLALKEEAGVMTQREMSIGISDSAGNLVVAGLKKGLYFIQLNLTSQPYIVKRHYVGNKDPLVAVELPGDPIDLTVRELFGVCVSLPEGSAISADFDWSTRPFDAIDATDSEQISVWQRRLRALAGGNGCVAVGLPRNGRSKIAMVCFGRRSGWWSFEEPLLPVRSIGAAVFRNPPDQGREFPTAEVRIVANRNGKAYRPFDGMRLDIWSDLPGGSRARLSGVVGTSMQLPHGKYKITMSGPPGNMFRTHEFTCDSQTSSIDLDVQENFESLHVLVRDQSGSSPRFCGVGYFDGRGHAVRTFPGDSMRLWVKGAADGLEPQEIDLFAQGYERVKLDTASAVYRAEESCYVLEAALR